MRKYCRRNGYPPWSLRHLGRVPAQFDKAQRNISGEGENKYVHRQSSKVSAAAGKYFGL